LLNKRNKAVTFLNNQTKNGKIPLWMVIVYSLVVIGGNSLINLNYTEYRHPHQIDKTIVPTRINGNTQYEYITCCGTYVSDSLYVGEIK